MRLTLYGIKNCDTMKKARVWLDEHAVGYVFHDYKAAGIDRASLERWCRALGWETVLNRAGRTFRALPEKDRESLDAERAIQLMIAQPSIIKRPVLEGRDTLLIGFKPDLYQQVLASQSRG